MLRVDRVFPAPLRGLLPALAVVVLAFASFHGNLFRAADAAWFAGFSQESEQLVLDGLLHAPPGAGAVLGHFERPSGEADAALTPRDFYRQENTAGEFVRYRSQYGLQVKAFALLRDAGVTDVRHLQAVPAFAMALVVAALFLLLRRDAGMRPALLVAAVLVLSPWLIVFARNLYWVSFTWFLPLLITMASARRIYESSAVLAMALALLFAAYLLKFLCGYEYLTAVCLAACVPMVYDALRQQRAWQQLLRVLVLHGVVALAALLVAFALHAQSLPVEDGKSGLQQILVTAEKRLASTDPAQMAQQVCQGDRACEAVMQASLESNPLAVLGTYFLVPDVLPWAGSARALADEQKQALRRLLRHPGAEALAQLRAQVDTQTLFSVFASRVLSPLCFLLFAVWAFVCAARQGRMQVLVLLAAAAAPVSWFVLAKGHSYIHTHLNYVLWYVPFVIYALVVCRERSTNE